MPDRKLDWAWEQCARALTATMNFVLWIARGFR